MVVGQVVTFREQILRVKDQVGSDGHAPVPSLQCDRVCYLQDKVPMVIAGNKSDLEAERQVRCCDFKPAMRCV